MTSSTPPDWGRPPTPLAMWHMAMRGPIVQEYFLQLGHHLHLPLRVLERFPQLSKHVLQYRDQLLTHFVRKGVVHVVVGILSLQIHVVPDKLI